MTDLAHEVFGNYDYEFAAEQRRTGEKGIVQKLGEKAVKWFRGMNEKRKAEKAERAYSGSLEEISNAVEPAAFKIPQAVEGQPGVYRSNQTRNLPKFENETDEIMDRAIARARKNLGALPVLAMHDTEPGRDDALLGQVQSAYSHDAVEPDRSEHVKPDDTEDGHLATTKGK